MSASVDSGIRLDEFDEYVGLVIICLLVGFLIGLMVSVLIPTKFVCPVTATQTITINNTITAIIHSMTNQTKNPIVGGTVSC